MNLSKLTPTQAGVTAAFIWLVGQAVTFIPGLSAEKQQLISVGTLVIAAVFVAIHAVHVVIALVERLQANKQAVTIASLEAGVRDIARNEAGKALGEVDLNKLGQAALAGQNIPALVKAEAQRVFGPVAAVLGQGQPLPVVSEPPAPAEAPPAVPPVA